MLLERHGIIERSRGDRSEEGGFINLGTLDIDLVEPALVTVVIRLGAAFPSSGWLLADAVKLEPVEAVE